MDIRTAADVLRSMLEGIDPETGEILPEEHLVFEDAVQQALALAVEVLLPQNPAGQRLVNKSGCLNAGRPWTDDELADLRRLYESGVSVDEIARLTQRRARGVRLQLNLMAGGGAGRDERVNVPDVIGTNSLTAMASAARQHGPANRHHPWTPEADAALTKQFQEGMDPAQLAISFGRSAYAIELRLQKLGLLNDDSPDAPMRPWSKDDVAELRKLHGSGLSMQEIAAHLNRTENAISARLFYMGLDSAAPELFLPKPPAREAPVPTATKNTDRPASGNSPSVSRRWMPEDDAYLRQAWAEGVNIQEMCTHLERRDRLVRCRLVYLDIADRTILGEAAASPELAHQGLPWYPEEIESLQHMFRQGLTHEAMAARLRRSVHVIRSRLGLLGLLENAPADS